MWKSVSLAPLNLNLGTRWRSQMDSFTLLLLYPWENGPLYPLNKRLGGRCVQEKILSPLLWIEPWFLGLLKWCIGQYNEVASVSAQRKCWGGSIHEISMSVLSILIWSILYFIVCPFIKTFSIENTHLWRYPMVAATKEMHHCSVSYVVWNLCMWKVLDLIPKIHFTVFVGHVIQNVSGVHVSWVPGHPSNASLHHHTKYFQHNYCIFFPCVKKCAWSTGWKLWVLSMELAHVAFVPRRILQWLLDFWKIWGSLCW